MTPDFSPLTPEAGATGTEGAVPFDPVATAKKDAADVVEKYAQEIKAALSVTTPPAEAVTRAEFNRLFHAVVSLANGDVEAAFLSLDKLAQMKPGKSLREAKPGAVEAPAEDGACKACDADSLSDEDKAFCGEPPTQPEPPGYRLYDIYSDALFEVEAGSSRRFLCLEASERRVWALAETRMEAAGIAIGRAQAFEEAIDQMTGGGIESLDEVVSLLERMEAKERCRG